MQQQTHLKEYATHSLSGAGKSQSSAHSSQQGGSEGGCDAWAWPGDKTLEQFSWRWRWGEEERSNHTRAAGPRRSLRIALIFVANCETLCYKFALLGNGPTFLSWSQSLLKFPFFYSKLFAFGGKKKLCVSLEGELRYFHIIFEAVIFKLYNDRFSYWKKKVWNVIICVCK